MFLSKATNGIYYIYYTTPQGKRLSKTTKSKIKSEASKVLIRFATEYKRQNSSELRPISLKKFRMEYLCYAESMLSWKTTLTYKTTFNAMLKHFGDIPLFELTTQRLEEYIQDKTRKVSVHAARKDLINIKAAFNKAVQNNYLSSNPALPLKRIKVPEKLPVFFTKEQLEQFRKVLPNQDWLDLVDFALNTGMRQKEIIMLLKRQFDSEAGLVILDNQYHLTKSRKVRTVPLNKTAYEILSRRGLNEKNEYLFTFGGEPIKQDYLVHWFKRYIKRAGIKSKLSFHSLRHTFATWLAQKDVSIYTISKLLGHADIKTTEIYAHLRIDDLRKSIELL